MNLCVKEGDHETGGFALMTISISPEANGGAKMEREPRLELVYEHYIFRASIYQAIHLPCKDEGGTVDPKMIIFFGSAMLTTSIMPQCVTPAWYECLEELVEVPTSPDMRPDIFMYVVDMDQGSLEALATLKYETSVAGGE